MTAEHENSTRAVIQQLWYRARINAFAHRVAADEASRLAKRYFQREIVATLFSILCVIAVYLISTFGTSALSTFGASPLQLEVMKLVFTFLSIGLTLYALYENVMANYLKLDIRSESHRHLLNSYQYIAQRAREEKWPDLPYADLVALLKDLERDFQLLKVRGSEPDDHHFDRAHEIVRKIRGDRELQIAQSFEIGQIETEAQHTGDPESLPHAKR